MVHVNSVCLLMRRGFDCECQKLLRTSHIYIYIYIHTFVDEEGGIIEHRHKMV